MKDNIFDRAALYIENVSNSYFGLCVVLREICTPSQYAIALELLGEYFGKDAKVSTAEYYWPIVYNDEDWSEEELERDCVTPRLIALGLLSEIYNEQQAKLRRKRTKKKKR